MLQLLQRSEAVFDIVRDKNLLQHDASIGWKLMGMVVIRASLHIDLLD